MLTRMSKTTISLALMIGETQNAISVEAYHNPADVATRYSGGQVFTFLAHCDGVSQTSAKNLEEMIYLAQGRPKGKGLTMKHLDVIYEVHNVTFSYNETMPMVCLQVLAVPFKTTLIGSLKSLFGK